MVQPGQRVGLAGEPETGGEEGDIECAAVVAQEPGGGGQLVSDPGQIGRLGIEPGEQILAQTPARALLAQQPGEKGPGAGAAGEPAGLGVETDPGGGLTLRV